MRINKDPIDSVIGIPIGSDVEKIALTIKIFYTLFIGPKIQGLSLTIAWPHIVLFKMSLIA